MSSTTFTAALSAALEPLVTAFIFSALVLCLFNFAAVGSSGVLKSAVYLLFKAVSASVFVLKYLTPLNSSGIFVVFPWGVANTILYFASLGMLGFCFLSSVVTSLTTLFIFLFLPWTTCSTVAANSFLGIVFTMLLFLALVSILPITPWLIFKLSSSNNLCAILLDPIFSF